MNELFIPPAGAMQFVPFKFPEHCMWIDGSRTKLCDGRRIEGCPHDWGWRVIHAPTMEPDVPTSGVWHVCPCVGRIIE